MLCVGGTPDFLVFLQYPDPKELQMNLTGFLHAKYARIFMQELWDLLLSAQKNIGGIPTRFLEQKKEELRRKKVRLTQFTWHCGLL